MPVPTIDRPVSALRQRMIEDMAMRGLRSDTQHEYIRFVRSFAAFLGQPPDTATAEDIRRFQVHQRESGVQPPTINCCVRLCASSSQSHSTGRIDRAPTRGVGADAPEQRWLRGQAATTGRLTVALSLTEPRVSRLM